MAELALAGEHHRYPTGIGRSNDSFVADRPARLNYQGDAGVSSGFDTIGEGIERIGGTRTSGCSARSLLRSDLCSLNPVLLTGADSPRCTILNEDDRI